MTDGGTGGSFAVGPEPGNSLELALDEFLPRFRDPQLHRRIGERLQWTQRAAAEKLEIYLNEARVGLRAVLPHLEPGQRVLEVGAGLCFLSLFLKHAGFDIAEPRTSANNYRDSGAGCWASRTSRSSVPG